ncbi:hypothetical protein J2T20_004217 [Paenibacillus wynnii]|nr:hypothetical protein [Paenibacillus wynnii]
MNTYYEIIKEYKREFSTKKFARKYLSSIWIFRMGIQATIAITIAIWGVTNDYDFYIIPYLSLV